MTSTQPPVSSLVRDLAQRLRSARRELTADWLERIVARVTTDPNRVFPTDQLLNHIPVLIDGIADYIESPAEEIPGEDPVVGKAIELGGLRHGQGFDAYEILKEYELLGEILLSYLSREADKIDTPCSKGELLRCAQRMFRAISVIEQATMAHFLRLADQRVADREERLRGFNHTVSHEIKNQIGAILGASQVLAEMKDPNVPAGRRRLLEIISNNARMMAETVENLVSLSTFKGESSGHRHVKLREAATEAIRQLRERAEEAKVDVSCGELPDVEVNAAAIELTLANLISNGIKYADSAKSSRFVRIDGEVVGDDGSPKVVVHVRDNGLGVPVNRRAHLFEKFFRAGRADGPVDGTGLGLSIVKETVESFDGKAWAEFPDEGSVFSFSVPLGRKDAKPRP